MNTRELNFAYKVRHVLNEQLDYLPPTTTDRLASARIRALSCKKKESTARVWAPAYALAGNVGGAMSNTASMFRRAGLVIPLVALVLGLLGMYKMEQQQRINETADIDAAVLSDELPLSAYLDHGFSAFLAKQAN